MHRFQEKLLIHKNTDRSQDKQPGRTIKTLNFPWEDDVAFEVLTRYQFDQLRASSCNTYLSI